MNFPMSGGVPEPSKQLMINALNFSNMGYDLTGPHGVSHADGEIWSKVNFAIRKLLSRQVRRRLPVRRRRSPARLCRGRAASADLPGQPALDAARLRRDAADAHEPDHAPGTRCPAGRRPDAVRRGEPEGAVARVRAARLRTQRDEHQHHGQHRHRSDAGLRGHRDGSRDGDVHGPEAEPERAGQRADLRRALRGPLLADRRHRPGDDGPEPWTTSPGSRRGPTSSSPPHRGTATFASASRSARART